jgi:hypothetical protein
MIKHVIIFASVINSVVNIYSIAFSVLFSHLVMDHQYDFFPYIRIISLRIDGFAIIVLCSMVLYVLNILLTVYSLYSKVFNSWIIMMFLVCTVVTWLIFSSLLVEST